MGRDFFFFFFHFFFVVHAAYTVDGCPTNGETHTVQAFSTGSGMTATVRCCQTNIDFPESLAHVQCVSKDEHDEVCLPEVANFVQAQHACANIRDGFWFLCTVDQLNFGVCCDTAPSGCGYDNYRVWTSDSADQTAIAADATPS